jgi:hypothetical protein
MEQAGVRITREQWTRELERRLEQYKIPSQPVDLSKCPLDLVIERSGVKTEDWRGELRRRLGQQNQANQTESQSERTEPNVHSTEHVPILNENQSELAEEKVQRLGNEYHRFFDGLLQDGGHERTSIHPNTHVPVPNEDEPEPAEEKDEHEHEDVDTDSDSESAPVHKRVRMGTPPPSPSPRTTIPVQTRMMVKFYPIADCFTDPIPVALRTDFNRCLLEHSDVPSELTADYLVSGRSRFAAQLMDNLLRTFIERDTSPGGSCAVFRRPSGTAISPYRMQMNPVLDAYDNDKLKKWLFEYKFGKRLRGWCKISAWKEETNFPTNVSFTDYDHPSFKYRILIKNIESGIIEWFGGLDRKSTRPRPLLLTRLHQDGTEQKCLALTFAQVVG